MKETIYVITNYENKKKPLDERFLKSEKNYIYYLIDKKIPEVLTNKRCFIECDLDPLLYEAGKKDFGEWSFLLAEEKYSFCEYPFFMISSRFYEKNKWLLNSIDYYWNDLFKLLKKYSFGFFPSYDRPIRWVSFSNWEKKIKREEWKFRFFPFTSDTSNLIKEVFDLHLSNEVKHSSDLFCNYIGFNSRDDLLEYVNFYKPLINYFFDDKYQLKTNLTKYIRHNVYPAHNPKEKIFTYILEAISHLYFYKNNKKFFALHYDGFYEIDEKNKKIKKLSKFNLSLNLRLQRFYEWQKVKFHTESSWPFFKNNMKKIGQKFFIN
ncbi:MAG: hypothetical protein KR126chlam6_01000 [Candidatus Anoxychlamydiales bacterium]|nr:hypothetical protein [Candidatus Anoxychlamydiales bacterium]